MNPLTDTRHTRRPAAMTLALTCTLAASAATAHVTLDQPRAPAGSTYKAALRVGHGCDGSPTHTVSVQVPAGYRGVKPVPKAGWALTIVKAPLAQPYTSHGTTVTEDVVQVTWQATSREAWLADAYYDEFVLRGQLPAQAGPLWFKVQQRCEKGVGDWSEVPASGTSTKGLKGPAALLEVTPSEAAAHQH